MWCRALLRVNRALAGGDVDRGDDLGWQLVMDSLALLVPGAEAPKFLDGRDALLEAFDARASAGGVAGNVAATRAARCAPAGICRHSPRS